MKKLTGGRSPLAFVLSVMAALLMTADRTQAQVYRWQDESGKTHYTDNPSSIPRNSREKADEIDTEKPTPTASNPAPPEVEEPPSRVAQDEAPRKDVWTVPIRPHGYGHTVEVLLDGKVKARLLIDTAASYTAISASIAEKLGYTELEKLPVRKINTAGGVARLYMIEFESVNAGGAVALDVQGVIASSVSAGTDGLLGQSFLKHFSSEVDRSRGVIIFSKGGR